MTVRALKSLISQTASSENYEILVIDNGSTDDTKAQVLALADATEKVSIRYKEEPRTGIAFARNTGYDSTSADYIAFIDDDAAAEPDWIERIIKNVQDSELPLIALGGKILPLYEVPKPSWFSDSYEARSWGAERRFTESEESFSASNLVVSRQAFIDVGGFPTDAGMSGERLMIGEEPLLFEKLWAQLDCTSRVLYDPEMKVRHSVPAQKMRVLYNAGRRFVAGQFNAKLQREAGGSRFILALRAFAACFIKAIFALFVVFRVKSFRRWIYEGVGEVGEPVGRFLALIGIEPKLKRI